MYKKYLCCLLKKPFFLSEKEDFVCVEGTVFVPAPLLISATLDSGLTTGTAAATWKVGVLTLVVLMAESVGALSVGVCGVIGCWVMSGGCSRGACTWTSLATNPPLGYYTLQLTPVAGSWQQELAP